MVHPLEIKLRELNDDQLQDRISMLYERLRHFYGVGNQSLTNQLQLFLNEATLEQNRRSEETMSSTEKRKKNQE
ncbi:hypothetical protein N9Z41_01865 [bacterium]|nr:hypothetical protein [bacterium]